MSMAICPTDPENPLKIAELTGDELSNAFFECQRFLFDRESWDYERIYYPVVTYNHAVDEMFELIRAFEFRGFQFEPPDEAQWESFIQRLIRSKYFQE